MGNNFCYSKNGMQSTMSQLICEQKFNGCEIYLTAGNIENESVECIVIPTDQKFSNVPQKDRPTFIPSNHCIYVGSTNKNQKNYILAVVQDSIEMSFQDQYEEEKSLIYEVIQASLKMANTRQIKSIAFPVFRSKDNTTSATIMILAIKFFIQEQKIETVTKIYITLNQLEQVNSFKWVFQQVFDQNRTNNNKSYSSTINPSTFIDEFKSIRLQQTNKESTP